MWTDIQVTAFNNVSGHIIDVIKEYIPFDELVDKLPDEAIYEIFVRQRCSYKRYLQ